MTYSLQIQQDPEQEPIHLSPATKPQTFKSAQESET